MLAHQMLRIIRFTHCTSCCTYVQMLAHHSQARHFVQTKVGTLSFALIISIVVKLKVSLFLCTKCMIIMNTSPMYLAKKTTKWTLKWKTNGWSVLWNCSKVPRRHHIINEPNEKHFWLNIITHMPRRCTMLTKPQNGHLNEKPMDGLFCGTVARYRGAIPRKAKHKLSTTIYCTKCLACEWCASICTNVQHEVQWALLMMRSIWCVSISREATYCKAPYAVMV